MYRSCSSVIPALTMKETSLCVCGERERERKTRLVLRKKIEWLATKIWFTCVLQWFSAPACQSCYAVCSICDGENSEMWNVKCVCKCYTTSWNLLSTLYDWHTTYMANKSMHATHWMHSIYWIYSMYYIYAIRSEASQKSCNWVVCELFLIFSFSHSAILAVYLFWLTCILSRVRLEGWDSDWDWRLRRDMERNECTNWTPKKKKTRKEDWNKFHSKKCNFALVLLFTCLHVYAIRWS